MPLTGPVRCWVTAEPWGVVSWVPGPAGRLTEAGVRFLVDQCFPLALKQRPPNARLSIIHDWRNVVGYDAAARAAIIEGAKLRHDIIGDISILVGAQPSPLVMMSIELQTLALQSTGTPITVFRDLTELQQRFPTLRPSAPASAA